MIPARDHSQLSETNAAHEPHDDRPDQAASSYESAQHRDIIRLRAVGECAHAQNVCQGIVRRAGCFSSLGGVRSLRATTRVDVSGILSTFRHPCSNHYTRYQHRCNTATWTVCTAIVLCFRILTTVVLASHERSKHTLRMKNSLSIVD